jgi:molybdenum-dependent DNA-binding transcriptional regulator ModE
MPPNRQKGRIEMQFSYLYAWEKLPGIQKISIRRIVESTRRDKK